MMNPQGQILPNHLILIIFIMKTYFAYIRVSTIKQGEHGVSLPEQKDAIQNYAKLNDLEITTWYEEKVTAAKRGRPAFNQMLKLLRDGKANGVIIHKIDRSARNLKDWADLGELIDKGVEVHFVNEKVDFNTRGGRLSADIQAVVAADYIRNLREETRKGFYGRIKQGLYPLPAPLGYLDKGKGKLKEPDPLRAPLIRKCFELYGSGTYNLKSLSEEMYKIGLRNRNGKKVSVNGFSIILNNPFYIGLIRLRRSGEIFSGNHQPLISISLFDRVQKILRGKTNTGSIIHDFRFRRMFICKHCGYSLIGEIQKGYIYYRCHTKNCPITCIKEETIENRISETFSSIQFNEDELTYMQNKVMHLKEDWKLDAEEQFKALSLNLDSLQSRLNRLTDAFLEGLIEKDIFENRKTHFLMEKKVLEEKILKLKNDPEPMPEKLSKFLELAGNAYLSYKKGFPEEKRDLMKIITSNRIVEGKNVLFELKLPFNEVVNRHEFSNGAPYRDRHRKRGNLPRKANNRKSPKYLDILFKTLVKYFSSQIESKEK